jgi:hypothetical protein
MKDDRCERSKYKGGNLADPVGIFRFEGEYEGERVCIVRCVMMAPETPIGGGRYFKYRPTPLGPY